MPRGAILPFLALYGVNMGRDYKKHRAMRNTARRRMIAAGKAKKGDGTHVDHIKPLSKGGTNGRKNLRVVKAKTNLKKGNRRK